MTRTRGLTHLALRVADPGRSFDFYRAVFDMAEVYRGDDSIQAQTPGTWDVLVFEKADSKDSGSSGSSGGIVHFGFRVIAPSDVDAVAAAVARAGGRITSKGEFVPGEPYVFFTDLDGYQVEAWYELPTPLDPPVEG